MTVSNLMNERQLVAVVRSKAALLLTAQPGHLRKDGCAPITAVACLQRSSRKRPFIQPLILEIHMWIAPHARIF